MKAASSTDPEEASRNGHREGAHILYADDEEALVKLAQIALPQYGYRVSAFTSARRALDAFQADPDAFDAVVTDMAMPEIDGPRLTREVLAIRPELLVILLSGFVRERDKALITELGVKQILLKPVMPEELHQALTRHLAR